MAEHPAAASPREGRRETREAGRELDALVAERVMGWSWWEWDAGVGLTRGLLAPNDWRPGRYGYTPSSADSRAQDASEHTVAPFSTSIAAAWQVVERLRELGWRLEFTNQDIPHAMFWQRYLRAEGIGQSAPTAPLAICRAALSAFPPAGAE